MIAPEPALNMPFICHSLDANVLGEAALLKGIAQIRKRICSVIDISVQ